VRLSTRALEGLRSSREQDVLHYQWCAAARVNAQLPHSVETEAVFSSEFTAAIVKHGALSDSKSSCETASSAAATGLHRFADLGNVDAQRAVGQILSAGGAGRDPEQALRYFQCAPPALHLLSNWHTVVAFHVYSVPAWQQRHLLLHLHSGPQAARIRQDTSLALTNPFQNHCRRAADGGDADAMAALGHMYANGRGVKASNGTALRWCGQTL